MIVPSNRIIIAGGRDYCDVHNGVHKIDYLLQSLDKYDMEIVSGGARGADAVGEAYAKIYKLPLKLFPAEWDKHGKSAGYIRNGEMARYSTHLIAFWDGRSKGTGHMIKWAKDRGLLIKIVRY